MEKLASFAKIRNQVLLTTPKCWTACVDHWTKNMFSTQITRRPSEVGFRVACWVAPSHLPVLVLSASLPYLSQSLVHAFSPPHVSILCRVLCSSPFRHPLRAYSFVPFHQVPGLSPAPSASTVVGRPSASIRSVEDGRMARGSVPSRVPVVTSSSHAQLLLLLPLVSLPLGTDVCLGDLAPSRHRARPGSCGPHRPRWHVVGVCTWSRIFPRTCPSCPPPRLLLHILAFCLVLKPWGARTHCSDDVQHSSS